MKPAFLILFACVCSLNGASVMSHHGRGGFLFDDTVTVAGKVTYFRWRNPHVYMEVQATNDKNEIETWLVETDSVMGLKKIDWEKNSIQVGDQVVVIGNPSRNAEKRHMLLDHVIREDGQIFYIESSKRTIGTIKNIPATSAASEDNVPSKDFSGTWVRGRTNHVTSDYFVPPKEGSWPLTEQGGSTACALR